MRSSDFQNLLSCLRGIMKVKKVTYAHLAKQLEVSEATVKRFFTSTDGSIGRIGEICSVLSISFSDLVEQAKSRNEEVFDLTLEQEKYFASHPHYLAFFMELLEKKRSIKEIRAKYKLGQHSAAKYLRQLEKMELVQWLPGDRVKLKVRGTHNWLENGPLVQAFMPAQNIAFVEYMLKNSLQEAHYFTASDRFAHPNTIKAVVAELQPLFSEIRKRVYRDELFYPQHELVPVKWILGIAPFEAALPAKVVEL